MTKRKSDSLRSCALQVFGESAQPLIPLLMPLLIDKDVATRTAAMTAVQRLDPKWYSSPAFRQLLPQVVQQLEVDDVETRVAAIRLLAYASPPARTGILVLDQWQSLVVFNLPQNTDMVNALARQLEDPELRVREASAITLGRLRFFAVTATAPLARHLVDKSLEVRRAVKTALPQINLQWRSDPAVADVVSELARQLDDRSVANRIVVLEALAFFGPTAAPATDRIAGTLEDPDVGVQLKSIEALGQIGPQAESALPKLVEKRSSATQRNAAERALTRIRSDWLQTVPQTDFVNALRESLANQPTQRWESLKQLRVLGTQAKAALPDVAGLVVDPEERVCRGALETLDALDPNWMTTEIGEQVLQALITSLAEMNDDVAISRVAALTRFGRRAAAARSALLSRSQHSDSRLREAALAAIGEVCEPNTEVIDAPCKRSAIRHPQPVQLR